MTLMGTSGHALPWPLWPGNSVGASGIPGLVSPAILDASPDRNLVMSFDP